VSTLGADHFYVATSLADAVAALAERGRAGAPLAGATWIMRAPVRGEQQHHAFVGISRIDELRRVDISDREVSIGACTTHAELAAALASLPDCRALAQAAGHSANPAIREVATVGGNICTLAFAAADLAPALICLDAELEFETSAGSERLPVARFLELRASLEPGYLVRRVIVPRISRRSAHVRLPLRKAGDYPVAIVSLALTWDADDLVESARVSVGSVEAVSRRWERLESSLVGQALDPQFAVDKARSFCGEFQGRDGVEAPGWYRVKVLPVLVGRAIRAIQN
jgi:carbon-monoxide dehydrogenase medium subunit